MTYAHEKLHLLIEQEIDEHIPIVWEEKIVREMLGEKWNKKLEKQYMEDEK